MSSYRKFSTFLTSGFSTSLGRGLGVRLSCRFTDAQPLKGLNYYRLRAVDLDGSSELSGIITVVFGAANARAYVYPNPATTSIRFSNEIDPAKVRR